MDGPEHGMRMGKCRTGIFAIIFPKNKETVRKPYPFLKKLNNWTKVRASSIALKRKSGIARISVFCFRRRGAGFVRGLPDRRRTWGGQPGGPDRRSAHGDPGIKTALRRLQTLQRTWPGKKSCGSRGWARGRTDREAFFSKLPLVQTGMCGRLYYK